TESVHHAAAVHTGRGEDLSSRHPTAEAKLPAEQATARCPARPLPDGKGSLRESRQASPSAPACGTRRMRVRALQWEDRTQPSLPGTASLGWADTPRPRRSPPV